MTFLILFQVGNTVFFFKKIATGNSLKSVVEWFEKILYSYQFNSGFRFISLWSVQYSKIKLKIIVDTS